MDAIATLDLAACVLAATEFITELLSPSRISQAQLPLSRDEKDEQTVLEALGRMRNALFDAQISSLAHQPSATAPEVSSNSSALRELSSSRDTAAELLEYIINVLGQSSDGPSLRPQGTGTRAWLRSRLTGTTHMEKLHRLSLTATRHVNFTLRYVEQVPGTQFFLFHFVFLFISFPP